MTKIPAQCVLCLNFDSKEELCSIYEQLPGEFGREDISDCPSYLDREKGESELSTLVKYLDEDKTAVLEESVLKIVDNVLSGYTDKFKVMVIGMARRKIKSMIKMVDITDTLIDRLYDTVNTGEGLTTSQSIKLLSELNMSINNDLGFVMKLVNPDTQLKDFQTYIDARSVNISTGASSQTEKLADEILGLTPTSRDKIRGAFDALLHNITPDDTYEDLEGPGELDKGDEVDG